MTREEVIELSDEGLWYRALCLRNGPGNVGPFIAAKRGGSASATIHGKRTFQIDCDYPHSIEAAWELFEKMIASGHDVAVHGFQEAGDNLSELHTWCTVDEDDELDSGGTTAPRAITRCFVLAMSGER